MNDIELKNAWKQFTSSNEHERAVICTVVKTRGSAYRCPGAKMIVFPDGTFAGIVSGGCLEADLSHRALALLGSDNDSEVVWYDTSRDDDILFGSGTGCAGQTVFLLEKITNLDTQLASNEARVECRIFESTDPSMAPLGTFGLREGDALNPIKNILADHAEPVRLGGQSEIRQISIENELITVLFEYLAPPIRLSIFGAGADSLPIVALARQLGWNVTIFDWRPAFARAERFAEGTSVICAPFEDLSSKLSTDPSVGAALNDSAVVLMSHSLSNDLAALRFILAFDQGNLSVGSKPVGSKARVLKYLGVLGPKKRTRRLLDELHSEAEAHGSAGILPAYEQAESLRCHPIFFPAGLDIGAEDPTEIAISIIAEITAVTRKRNGGFLKDRNAPIHDEMPTAVSEITDPIVNPSYVTGTCDVSLSPTNTLRIGAIILAAGKAERFGAPKQLLEYKEHSLIENAIGAADAVNCDPILVVTGAYHYELLEHITSLKNQNQLSRLEIKQNSQWQKGIGTSISFGVKLLEDRVDAILLIACDQPFINASLFGDMVNALNNEAKNRIVASKYAETFGIPALFRADLFGDLQSLPPNKGAKLVIQKKLERTLLVDFPQGAVDIDTAQDYACLLDSK